MDPSPTAFLPRPTLDTPSAVRLAGGQRSWHPPTVSARRTRLADPSYGLAPTAYTANVWPRSAALFQDDVISDFAPDDRNSDHAPAVPIGVATPLAVAAGRPSVGSRNGAAATGHGTLRVP